MGELLVEEGAQALEFRLVAEFLRRNDLVEFLGKIRSRPSR
jgi:hypothetical protein